MSLTAVTLGYPGRTVIEGLSCTVGPRARLGVVGENGSGKSTLLRAIAEAAPHWRGSAAVLRQGTIWVDGPVTLVGQDMPASDLTVGDVVDAAQRPALAALARWQEASAALAAAAVAAAELRAEVSAAGAEVDRLDAWRAEQHMDEALTRFGAVRARERPLAEMSVGERHRVRLAAAIAGRFGVLLLDEPTNHLDEDAVAYLMAAVREWPAAVVVVSHDRFFLDGVVTSILDLDPAMDGRPTLYGGVDYLGYRERRTSMLTRWRQRFRDEQRRAAELAATLDASYEGLSDEWRPGKGSRRHRRATRARQHVKSADRAIVKLESTAVDVPLPPPALCFPVLPGAALAADGTTAADGDVLVGEGMVAVDQASALGAALITLADVVVGDRLDLRGRTVRIAAGGRLAVVGPNGAGKSTLLAALAGRIAPDGGVRHAPDWLRIGYLAQDAHMFGDGNETGFDRYARLAVELLLAGRVDPARVHPIAAMGLLTEEDLSRPLWELSVGQRRRFELACTLLADPQVLIIDEPTNHLSTTLIDELSAALIATPAAVVLATHDRALLRDIGDWPRLELRGGGLSSTVSL